MLDLDPLTLLVAWSVAIVAMLTTGGVLVGRGRRRRSAALAELADRRGWRYDARARDLDRRWSGAPFDRGRGRRRRHALTGTHEGRSVTCFEHEYTVSAGGADNRTIASHHHAVVVTATGGRLPDLEVSPRTGRERRRRRRELAVELESEEFARAFSVAAADRRFASDLLHPAMMALLLERPELSWRWQGGDLLLVRPGRIDPDDLDDDVRRAAQVLDLVPAFVWRDHGSEHESGTARA